MSGPRQQLQTLSEELLSGTLHYGNVREAANSLYRFFSELTGFSDEDPVNQLHVPTASGLAVSPYSAAFCLIDFMRTRSFISGLRTAILERLERQPGKPVTILYAGTGPFATLVTPLCAFFTPAQIRLVLLDVNPVSLSVLKDLYKALALQDYIAAFVEADACQWTIPDDLQPDILLSETMKPGLEKEPQVAICCHLLSQCTSAPILIPKAITVSAALTGDLHKAPDDYKILATLFSLTKETAIQLQNSRKSPAVTDDGVTIEIPDIGSRYKDLVLHTTIEVYGNWQLLFNQCSLTLPHRLAKLSGTQLPVQIRIWYEQGINPGFRYSSVV